MSIPKMKFFSIKNQRKKWSKSVKNFVKSRKEQKYPLILANFRYDIAKKPRKVDEKKQKAVLLPRKRFLAKRKKRKSPKMKFNSANLQFLGVDKRLFV